jgi:hypothetical protein
MKLERTLIDIINSKDTVKILSTVDEAGVPHTVVKQSLRVNEDGLIEYLELMESSRSFKNLTRSLWFDGKVSLLFHTRKGISWQIKGTPVRVVICGPVFEENYIRIRKSLGDVDLAAVCFIMPEEIIDETFSTKFKHQETQRPFLKHLDRIAGSPQEDQGDRDG